jgi:glutamyl-tRNA reductase
MARQIFAAEVSYENAPACLLEKLAMHNEGIKFSLQSLRMPLDEVVVLATDNRFVVYAVADSVDPLLNFFLQDPESFRYVQFYKNSEATLNHLFATASGLCSPIRGDDQILTQIRQTHQFCLEFGTIGLLLDNTLREAIRVGKKVRDEAGIDEFGPYLVDAAFVLLYSNLLNLYKQKFLVIGSGKIATLALAHLKQEGIQNVVIASHDVHKVAKLGEEFGAKVITMDNVVRYFQDADVVIGGPHHQASLRSIIAHEIDVKKGKNKIILDFGVPWNFNQKGGKNALIELYNLDDIKEYSSTIDSSDVELAWKIVAEEARQFLQVTQQLDLVPVLARYWHRHVSLNDGQQHGSLPRVEDTSFYDIEFIKTCAQRLIHCVSREPLRNYRAMTGDTQLSLPAYELKHLYVFNHVKLNPSNN